MTVYCIACIVLGFTLIQWLVSLVNLCWRERLPRHDGMLQSRVSVLIPARNEAGHIQELIYDLLRLRSSFLEIIVCDDHSSDQTLSLMQQIARKEPSVRIIQSESLPPGWLGKNFACHQLAKEAKGDYFLFLDADVRTGRGCIWNAVRLMQKERFGLVSIFPMQIMFSWGEKLTVPVMNYILLSLLPLIGVRKTGRFPSIAAANGQFMLFDASVYRVMSPHAYFRNQKVEDIAIARFFKSRRIKIACLLGDERITCRMYSGYREAVNGFARNIRMYFGNSLLLMVLFWLITTWGFAVVWCSFSPGTGIGYLIVLFSIRLFTSLASRQSVGMNLFLFPFQLLSCGWIIYKSIFYSFKHKQQWKGRTI